MGEKMKSERKDERVKGVKCDEQKRSKQWREEGSAVEKEKVAPEDGSQEDKR